MIKVRVLQNLGLGVTSAAALVGMTPLGCDAPTNIDETYGRSGEALARAVAVTDPGTGTIRYTDYQFSYASTSGGDEFIRTGERLALGVDFSLARALLSYDWEHEGAFERIGDDPANITATFTVVYQNLDGTEISRASLPVAWRGEAGATEDLVVPQGTPRFTVTLGLAETSGAARYETSSSTFWVFGAFPGKVTLFDNDGSGARRQRIIEGGALRAGKDVTLSYTDWRADGVVDRTTLDTVIGEGRTFSRFGAISGPIRGRLEYDVEFVYSTDGGLTWRTGGMLAKHAAPATLSQPEALYRSAFEKTMRLPGDATSFELAFRIRAYVVADPTYQIVDRWRDGYQLNGRYLLRDAWDNNGGRNYAFSVER